MVNTAMSPSEVKAFREMAASFAGKSVAPMLAHESPDGNMDLLPGIIEQGLDTGLVSAPAEDAPGYDMGIWGKSVTEVGPAVSLMLLQEIATVCAGVAMAFHAQGLASLVLHHSQNDIPDPPQRPGLALSESFGWPGLNTLKDPAAEAPAKIETLAREAPGGCVISGEKPFVYGLSDCDGYIVFARHESGGWRCFMVADGSEGLKVERDILRTGLRSAAMQHLVLKNVSVSEDSEMSFSMPQSELVMELVRMNMLGLCAIATGTAAGALIQAKDYAGERWQGCAQIIEHPAVRSLLAESDARIAACRAILESAAGASGSPEERLVEAAKAKLQLMPAAAGAVTDCLQVFGGYGYMEDYRMEKRLRDVSTLKSAGGSPLELRRMIADATL